MLSDDLAEAFDVPQSAGLLLTRVARNSPTEKLGLKAGSFRAVVDGQEFAVGGNVILSVGGTTVTVNPATHEKIREYWRELNNSDPFELKILRKGKVYALSKPISEL